MHNNNGTRLIANFERYWRFGFVAASVMFDELCELVRKIRDEFPIGSLPPNISILAITEGPIVPDPDTVPTWKLFQDTELSDPLFEAFDAATKPYLCALGFSEGKETVARFVVDGLKDFHPVNEREAVAQLHAFIAEWASVTWTEFISQRDIVVP